MFPINFDTRRCMVKSSASVIAPAWRLTQSLSKAIFSFFLSFHPQKGLGKVSQETQSLQKSMQKLNDNFRVYQEKVVDSVYLLLPGDKCVLFETLHKEGKNYCQSQSSWTEAMKNDIVDSTVTVS